MLQTNIFQMYFLEQKLLQLHSNLTEVGLQKVVDSITYIIRPILMTP